ncbi:antibiotic hydrolase [Falsiroseomonas bella]|uniref:Antibiotic hydrolase n=1 Tax=Falsiroseomonas bella TaxID=2184016 RepID=A0A317FIM9_9PROT|nr:CocE/NonD family hydrolase [Falsiroseomonas bella]PWS38954.1 antibiotic hydrolase [Falsiroseomonas bella]
MTAGRAVNRMLRMPMRDGAHLAASLYLPEGGGPFPVVLERTPYGRDAPRRVEVTAADPNPMDGPRLAAHFTRAGYAVVLQDCRGRGESGGVFEKYLNEGADGFDSCAWLLRQPWCDGRIATIGMSYGAHSAAALGCLDPPGLVAQILDSGGFDNGWRNAIRQNGAFELKQASWAFNEARRSPEAAADPVLRAALEAEDLAAWFTRTPWREGHSPLRHHPAYERVLLDQWRAGTFDDGWRRNGLWAEGYYETYSRAALLHMSSWFDPYPATATCNYRGLKQAGRGPQRLILGPWTHGERSARVFGDVDFGPDAPIDSWAGDWNRHRVRFLDHAVRGVADGEPTVRVFVMGGGSGRRTPAGHLDHGGRWISVADWPLPGAMPTVFHLHRDGALRRDAPAAGAAPVSFRFDPANPVPTIGGGFSSLEPIASPGSQDQVEAPGFFGCRPPYLPLASRADVVVFQTPPLAAPLQVVGPVEIELFVATDAPDTDFTVKLVDVHPPSADYPRGYAMLLGDTIMRLRYAEDPARPRLSQPGEVRRVRLSLPIANLFLAGHRIRLDVSSSNFPRFDVNPNTGEPEGEARGLRCATNTIFLDAGRASRLMLPLLD